MRIFKQIVLLSVAGIPGLTPAQADDTTDRLITCARIEEQSARAACYETLGRQVLAEDSDNAGDSGSQSAGMTPPAEKTKDVPVAATPTAAATSAPTNVPYKGEDRDAEEYRIAVTSCEQNKNRELYFILENGEIWKQTGGKRVKESDCDFAATLRKDVFGYKMTIDGDKGGIRVKRVQ